MNRPRVSIVIPVHNGSDSLKETIDSALAQTYDNIEIIVISDTPNDDGATEKVTKSYGKKITYYNKQADGVASALNLGVQKMSGSYFSWLSPGDTYYPDTIEKQVTSIGETSNAIIVSDWTIVNKNGVKTEARVLDGRLEKYPGCFLAFNTRAPLNTCAMLIPADALKNNGSFDGSLPPLHDYKMLNRLILAGARVRVVNEPLLSFRSHPEHEPLMGLIAANDFVHSDIIDTLSCEDIVGYFGSQEDAVGHYKQTLSSGFPRTAAFLIAKIIRGSIGADGYDPAKAILLDDLSRLPETKMATSGSALISKIVGPTAKKKILFCSAHWLTGGMERVMSILFGELKDDYEIFLITPYDERKSSIDIPDFVTSIKIANDLFLKHFDSLILSYALLLDIDVAIGYINLFEKQLNLYKLCAGTKIRTIASNHEYYFYPYKSRPHYEVVEKRLSAYQTCDALVWPNNFNAALCGMYVDNNYVIGNPNTFEVAQEESRPANTKTIICVGRFDDYVKRIDRILECFALVLKQVPDAKLVLVGRYNNDAPLKQDDSTTVNDLISVLAIPPASISFVGEVNNVHNYYSEAQVLMLTSSSEGFGMVVNEAACFGVPSVCNYIPGIEDIVVDGETGFITEQDDIKSMAVKVTDILTNNELRARLSKNAKKQVTLYDARHIGSKWKYLIDSLIQIKDSVDLRRKLNSELGYEIKNQQLLLRALSRELNEIFYMISEKERDQHRIADSVSLILSKVKRLPARLRANIEYEGWLKTSNKITVRSYRVARNILKI